MMDRMWTPANNDEAGDNAAVAAPGYKISQAAVDTINERRSKQWDHEWKEQDRKSAEAWESQNRKKPQAGVNGGMVYASIPEQK